MNLRNLYPLLDVEHLETETDPQVVNQRLREGLRLILAYTSPDGVGGFFAVYVLGRLRAATNRSLTDRPINDHDEFDQRHHG